MKSPSKKKKKELSGDMEVSSTENLRSAISSTGDKTGKTHSGEKAQVFLYSILRKTLPVED